MKKENMFADLGAGQLVPASSFWMVYCPTGGRAPAHQHPTFEAAQAEARRIAQKQNQPAYILQAVQQVQVVAQFTETDLAA